MHVKRLLGKPATLSCLAGREAKGERARQSGWSVVEFG